MVQSIPTPAKDEWESTYDRLIREGKIAGIEIGEKQGEKKGKLQQKLEFTFDLIRMFPTWTDKQIAELAKVEESIIKELRKVVPTKKQKSIIKAARPLFKELEGYQEKKYAEIDALIKAVWKTQGEHKSDSKKWLTN